MTTDYTEVKILETETIVKATGIKGDTGTAGITISATPPATPQINDLWLDIS